MRWVKILATIDRLKRKVVSRLTGEVDVYYFDVKNQLDNKIAKLTYGNREVIIDKSSDGTFAVYYKKEDEYYWKSFQSFRDELSIVINDSKEFIKDNEVWRFKDERR